MALTFFFHSLGKAWEGAARGLGKQAYGAGVLLFSLYIVGLPLISYFVFSKELGMYGIWLGPTIGAVIENLLYMFLFSFSFDWEVICEEIHRLLIAS